MRPKAKVIFNGVVLVGLLLSVGGVSAEGSVAARARLAPVGAGFTYQGLLKNGSGQPVTGGCDFQFTLWADPSTEPQIGVTSTVSSVSVAQGYFTVQVNTSGEFGASAFNGEARWLAIAVRCPAGTGGYTALSPRQLLTAAPYALYAAQANVAVSATNAATATYALAAPWAGLAGIPAGFADGVDADTLYTAGAGLDLSGNLFSVITGTIQQRVSEICALGSTIRAIQADGTVVCQDVTQAITATYATTAAVAGDADLLDGQHGNFYAAAAHSHYSLDAADGSPTQALYVDNNGRVGIGTTVPSVDLQVGGGGTIWAFGQVDRDPAVLTNLPHFATYIYGGPPGTTARYGMSHYYGLTLNAYEDDLGDPHWGVIKFFTGGDGLPLAERVRIDYAGNVGIGVTNPLYPIHLASGAYVSAGGTWTNASDMNLKENFAPVDNLTLLEKISQLPISMWNYKAESGPVKHIGPMAQDFYAAFGVGEDNTHIATIDADGVALAAIQGLNTMVQEKEARIAVLEAESATLKARVQALEQNTGVGGQSNVGVWQALGLTLAGLLVSAAVLYRKVRP